MIINGSSKINDKAGDYIALCDYGSEGFTVGTQAKTQEEAMTWINTCCYGCPMTLVRLVRFDVKETEEVEK